MGLDSVEGASRASYIVSTSIYNSAAQVTILSSQQYYELQADALSTFRARQQLTLCDLLVNMFLLLLGDAYIACQRQINDMELACSHLKTGKKQIMLNTFPLCFIYPVVYLVGGVYLQYRAD
jgi:hypothetical protein